MSQMHHYSIMHQLCNGASVTQTPAVKWNMNNPVWAGSWESHLDERDFYSRVRHYSSAASAETRHGLQGFFRAAQALIIFFLLCLSHLIQLQMFSEPPGTRQNVTSLRKRRLSRSALGFPQRLPTSSSRFCLFFLFFFFCFPK